MSPSSTAGGIRMAVTAARAGPNNFSPNLERDARSVCSEVLGLSVRSYQKRYQWTESSPHHYFALSEAAILTQRPVAWLLPTAAAVGIGGEALGSGIGHRSLARRTIILRAKCWTTLTRSRSRLSAEFAPDDDDTVMSVIPGAVHLGDYADCFDRSRLCGRSGIPYPYQSKACERLEQDSPGNTSATAGLRSSYRESRHHDSRALR